MITLKCNLPVLRINDLTPTLVLSQGVVEVDDRVIQRSAQLRNAIQKGEVKIVTSLSQRDSPEKGLKRRRTPEPDYEDLHNRFMESTKSIDNPLVVDTETHRLLRQLIASVDHLSSNIKHTVTESTPQVHPASHPASHPLHSQNPSFIPSDLQARDVKSSRIHVTEETEDSGLGDAEAALRRLKEIL